MNPLLPRNSTHRASKGTHISLPQSQKRLQQPTKCSYHNKASPAESPHQHTGKYYWHKKPYKQKTVTSAQHTCVLFHSRAVVCHLCGLTALHLHADDFWLQIQVSYVGGVQLHNTLRSTKTHQLKAASRAGRGKLWPGQVPAPTVQQHRSIAYIDCNNFDTYVTYFV